MVDVSQHELVPDHTVIDEETVEDLLAEYGIERTDLPKIRRKDPALPDEAELGDVIKVTRESRTTDEATTYRLVIE